MNCQYLEKSSNFFGQTEVLLIGIFNKAKAGGL